MAFLTDRSAITNHGGRPHAFLWLILGVLFLGKFLKDSKYRQECSVFIEPNSVISTKASLLSAGKSVLYQCIIRDLSI